MSLTKWTSILPEPSNAFERAVRDSLKRLEGTVNLDKFRTVDVGTLQSLEGAASITCTPRLHMSAQFRADPGTTAAPGIAFTSSPSTGLSQSSGGGGPVFSFVLSGEAAIDISSQGITLRTDNTSRWTVDPTDGHLLAATDDAINIGASGDNRPQNVYVARTLFARALTTAGEAVRIGNDASLHDIDTADTIQLRGLQNATQGWLNFGSGSRLVMGADGTDNWISAEAGQLLIRTNTASAIVFRTNNTARWTFDANGHLVANTDNSFDIGASGATRPRNLFVANDGHFGGDLSVGDDLAVTGDMTLTGQAVSFGANDSGGTGFRTVLVPNS